jgi:hypothetical protein
LTEHALNCNLRFAMKLNAAMDPILAIIIGVGWLVIKALQSRRKDADSWDETEQPAPRPHVPQRNQGPPPLVIQKPGPQSLPPFSPRTILIPQPKSQTSVPPQKPPIVRTVTSVKPMIVNEPEGPTGIELGKLKQSEDSYSRASHLQQAVANRLSAIDKQTATPRATAPKARARSLVAAHTLRTMRNPITVRQAFVAAFVLNPPKALE